MPNTLHLGAQARSTTRRNLITLSGAALADEPRPVVTVTAAKPGPVLFVNAGVHGGEYPGIEAVIRLGRALDSQKIAGTVILMPALNLPAFRKRTMFVWRRAAGVVDAKGSWGRI
jgi:predicted deacylase